MLQTHVHLEYDPNHIEWTLCEMSIHNNFVVASKDNPLGGLSVRTSLNFSIG